MDVKIESDPKQLRTTTMKNEYSDHADVSDVKNSKMTYKWDVKHMETATYNKDEVGRNGQLIYKCEICLRMFSEQLDLDVHLGSHIESGSHVCLRCGKAFVTKEFLDIHVKKHTSVAKDPNVAKTGKLELHKCFVCGKMFVGKDFFEKHMQTHGFKGLYEMPKDSEAAEDKNTKESLIMGTGEVNKSEDDENYLEITPDASFDLDEAMSSAESSDNQILNRRTHGIPYAKAHECSVCSKRFANIGSLNHHFKMHTNARPFLCGICGKRYKAKQGMDEHIRTHTGDMPYKCSVCSLGFNRSYTLTEHMRRHSEQKLHKCFVCSASFSQKDDLDLHMETHSTERPYKCSECSKCFAGKGRLALHWRTHSGEKPYECSFCSKRFADRGAFSRHLQMHNNDRPHKCEICGKGFIEKRNFVEHMRLHSGEKPFKCPMCDKAYAQKRVLQRHQRKHAVADEAEPDSGFKAFDSL